MYTWIDNVLEQVDFKSDRVKEPSYDMMFGLAVLSRTLLGYRERLYPTYIGERWSAIYEVNTPEGVKYVSLNYDGYCGLYWLDKKPALTHSEPPWWFPKDPWSEVRHK